MLYGHKEEGGSRWLQGCRRNKQLLPRGTGWFCDNRGSSSWAVLLTGTYPMAFEVILVVEATEDFTLPLDWEWSSPAVCSDDVEQGLKELGEPCSLPILWWDMVPHMVPRSGGTYGTYKIFLWPCACRKASDEAVWDAYFFVAPFLLHKNGHNLISLRKDFTSCWCFGYYESTWK